MPLDIDRAALDAKAEGAGAPGTEIEITMEMIAAGADEIWESGFGGCGDDSALGLAECVLVASLRAGGFSVRNRADRLKAD